jgi:hypothetical protein
MSTRSSWPRTGPAREPLEHECLIEKSSVDITGLRRHDALDDVKILGRILLPMLAASPKSISTRSTSPRRAAQRSSAIRP